MLCGGKTNSLLQKLVIVWANNYECSKREASVLRIGHYGLRPLPGIAGTPATGLGGCVASPSASCPTVAAGSRELPKSEKQ